MTQVRLLAAQNGLLAAQDRLLAAQDRLLAAQDRLLAHREPPDMTQAKGGDTRMLLWHGSATTNWGGILSAVRNIYGSLLWIP